MELMRNAMLKPLSDEDRERLRFELRRLEESRPYRQPIATPQEQREFDEASNNYRTNMDNLWGLFNAGKLTHSEFSLMYSKEVFPHLERAEKIRKGVEIMHDFIYQIT